MGTNASKSVLHIDRQLGRLTGDQEFPASREASPELELRADEDDGWRQLFSSFQQLPLKQQLQPGQVAEVARTMCVRMALNNPKTKNFHRLVAYVAALLARQRQQQDDSECSAAASAECAMPARALEDEPTTLLDGLYLVRVFAKHFIETLDAAGLATQLQVEERCNASDEVLQNGTCVTLSARTPDLLVNALMDYCSSPVRTASYEAYRDSLELLLVLMSTRMHKSLSDEGYHPFLDACIRYSRSNKFTHAMLLNFIHQRTLPPVSLHTSFFSMIGTAASGLLAPWSSWYSYLFASSSANGDAPGSNQASPRTLSQLSLLVLLGLAIHIPSDIPALTLQTNPFRKQLSSFSDLYYSDANEEQTPPTNLSSTDNHFCLSYSELFESLPSGLDDDTYIMLLYMLIHTNSQFLSYLLARSDIDTLLLPLMEALYKVEDQSQEQRAYMILVCLVIITQDKLFNQNLHHLMLDEVTWHKERLLRDISLGSLLVVVLVRSVQISLSKLRDSYLPVHCLASLGNMSMYFEGLHQYAAHRLIKLFEIYSKRHRSLTRRLTKDEDSSTPTQSSPLLLTGAEAEVALSHTESCMEIVLEILNSSLTNALRANPQLSYALLHDKALFTPYIHNQRFSPLLHNIQAVLDHFQLLLNQVNLNELTPSTILEIIQRGSLTWQSREYPVQYTYEEEDNAQDFFALFLWNVIRLHTPDFNWDAQRLVRTDREFPGEAPDAHVGDSPIPAGPSTDAPMTS